LREWWQVFLEKPESTHVEGWTPEEIDRVHDAVLAELKRRQPPELVFAGLVRARTLEGSPGQVEAEVIGLDYETATPACAVRLVKSGGRVYAVTEVRGSGWALAELDRQLGRLVPERNVPVASVFARAELPQALERRGWRVIALPKGRVSDRIAIIARALADDILRISQDCPALIEQLETVRRAEDAGVFVNEYRPGQERDAVDALGYGLRALLGEVRPAESGDQCPAPGTTMPIRPSGERQGPELKLEEVLEYIKPFKIRTDIVRLTGGLAIHGRTAGDIDVYIERVTWEDLLRIIAFRLYRGLPEHIAKRLSFLEDHTGGCFTTNVPLGDLWFIPRRPFVKVEMAVNESLRAATPEVRADAEASEKEDRVRPHRMFYPAKPARAGGEGYAQTPANFLALFEAKDFPRLVSAKLDGNTFIFSKLGRSVRIWSDDGLENEFLETLRERVSNLAPSSLVFMAEVTLTRNGVHYPREAVRAVAAGARPDWEPLLVANVFEVLYYNGRDIHRLPAEERYAIAQRVDWDAHTDRETAPDVRLNLIPQYVARNKKELAELVERLSKLPGSEGVIAKRGPWPLKPQAQFETSVKYHKAVRFVAKIVERHETKTPGVFTYEYALAPPYRKYSPAERVMGSWIPVGRTFSTSQKLSPRDHAVVEVETLNIIVDVDQGTYLVTGWSPKVLERTREAVSTVDEAVAAARRAGVLREKWIQEGEIYYDERELRQREEVVASVPMIWIQGRTEQRVFREDPYLVIPEPGFRARVMRHAHFRGRSAHSDCRRLVEPGWLVGWTENLQRPGKIREPVHTLAEAKRYLRDYDLAKGNEYFKGLIAAGGQQIVVEKKEPEPGEWFDFEGVQEIGRPGSTAEHPGVFVVWDQGETEWGAQKANEFHEYFDSGGKIFNGRYVVRSLANIWGEEKTGKGPTVWMAWYSADPVPYVLSSGAQEKGWLPPQGFSALPALIRNRVPKKLQFWRHKPTIAKRLRDELIKEKLFTKETLGFNARNELIYLGAD
jgi:hypothetical protein